MAPERGFDDDSFEKFAEGIGRGGGDTDPRTFRRYAGRDCSGDVKSSPGPGREACGSGCLRLGRYC